jgi:hypothetical protein
VRSSDIVVALDREHRFLTGRKARQPRDQRLHRLRKSHAREPKTPSLREVALFSRERMRAAHEQMGSLPRQLGHLDLRVLWEVAHIRNEELDVLGEYRRRIRCQARSA